MEKKHKVSNCFYSSSMSSGRANNVIYKTQAQLHSKKKVMFKDF